MTEHHLCRILVVDDDIMIRQLLELFLKRSGYEVDQAESGEMALTMLAREDQEKPDAVLADMQLPGIAGSALAANIRTQYGDDIRLIAMSGSQPENTMLKGFDGFLRKPFTEDVLKQTLGGNTPWLSEQKMPSSGTMVLHQIVYERLAASMSHEKLTQLYELCLSDTLRRVEAIRGAARHGDDTACRKQGHAIQGSCSMVGASQMESLGRSIESHGLVANLMDTLDELTRSCTRLKDILGEHGIIITKQGRQSGGEEKSA